MKLIAAAAATLLLVSFLPGRAQSGIPPYSEESSLIATTPGSDDGAIAAMINPAQWGLLPRSEMAFWWSDQELMPKRRDDYGFAFGSGVGFSYRHFIGPTADGPRGVGDYQIGFGAGGSGGQATGLSYGFSGPGRSAFGRKNFLSIGHVSRPSRWLSVAGAGRFASGASQGVFDAGIRPLGDQRLLLFGDYEIPENWHWDDGAFAGGIALRPIAGLEAAAKWSEDDRLQLSLGITLNRTGVRSVSRYQGGDLGATNFIARTNPPVRGVDVEGRVMKGRRYLEMDMNGEATYQAYRFWDQGSLPLRATLDRLQFAIDDPTVGGVALNLSGYAANIEMSWELREKLLALKRAGKRVVVYCDNLGTGGYYLASAADHIILDPQGSVTIPGIQFSRTYMKDALAKMGIGFDEWRFLKYKSALEALSRRDMSEADREQLGALARDTYEEVASGIVATGRVTRERFDTIVNEEPYLSPKRLLALKWIDQIGRWEDVKAVAGKLAGKKVLLAKPDRVRELRRQPDETWGPVPTIALVYQIGECAMDTGIKGRESSKALKKFRERRDVKAVVMRVDSPGGDPLPSDLVAREMRDFAKSGKPIYVSQGRVAGSGGYWISMPATKISTSPFTLTGSIGVIGGWAWNEGLGGKLGLTSDHVQVGKSADLAGGLTLPLLDIRIPERNLDAHERELMKQSILDLYAEFTSRVAEARGLEVARVREIAEGRIYMGRAAMDLKLVDRVATLDETIREAKRAAGIPEDRRVRIEEYPRPGLFKLPGFARRVTLRTEGSTDIAGRERERRGYDERGLGLLLANPGKPLLLTPASLLPDEPPAR